MKQKLFNDYGMVLVLIALCLLFSLATIRKQTGDGPTAAKELVSGLERHTQPDEIAIIAGAANTASETLAQRVAKEVEGNAGLKTQLVIGTPRDLRLAIEAVQAADQNLGAIAIGGDASKWRVLEQIPENFPEFAEAKIIVPSEGWQSNFLKGSNLIAVVDRIVVIAVIAIGMTLVIITGGIDLSVGSLIALSAVTSTLVMKKLGGLEAPAGVVFIGFAAGVAACGLMGAGTGALIAQFKVAPFIVTLGVM
ncbi:MAG: ABC transporter permease, partial [Verrucomicrobiota bacterium]